MRVVCVVACGSLGWGCGGLADDLNHLKEVLERGHEERSPKPDQPPPRLLAPLTGSVLSTNRPRFRWQLQGEAEGATVDICSDRQCRQVLASFTVAGAAGEVRDALPAGRVFWRARGTRKGHVVTAPAGAWEIFVPHRTSAPSTALGARTDVDGDGFCDFLLDDRVLRGTASGYSGIIPLPAGNPDAAASAVTFAGDLNGDGLGDVLRLEASADMTSFGIWSPQPLLSNGDGFVAGEADAPSMPIGAIYNVGAAGDINGDGYADLLVKTRFDAVTYLGNPGGLSEATTPAAETSQSFFGWGGDINGDGFADAASTSNGVAAITVTLGSAAGFAPSSQTVALPEPPVTGLVTMVDANGDGFSDLAVTRSAGGIDLFAGGPGGLQTGPVQTLPASCAPAPCAPAPPMAALTWGDFNGDGWPDLLTSVGQQFAVHQGGAGGMLDPAARPLPTAENASIQPARGAVGDVNGDGFDDLTATLFEVDPDTGQPHATAAALYLGGGDGLAAPQPAAIN